ncbi:MAG: glycosyltransferase [Deltaproteobacteria bacterium]|nr:glycosyltransferase [Deltaproteobacteria bacterium]
MDAIRARRPGVHPAPKGRLGIAAIYHDYNWEEGTLRPALEKFGDVRRYDWVERFDHGRKDWASSVKTAMNRDLLDILGHAVREGPLHAVFAYLSGEIVDPATVEAMSALGVPMVNLALNDTESFVGRVRGRTAMGARDICRHFDLCWTSTRNALEKYVVEGAVPVYLPEGANPELHRPYHVPKEFDVSFVGMCHGNRPEVVARLRRAGIGVEAFGRGWPNGPLPTEEMVRTYSRSRINLGFGGIAGYKDTYHLKGRDFEVPMSGGLYLTEHHDELADVFDIGKEIVTYSGFDDLVSKIRWLLDRPEEAEAIRRAGHARAIREHTWEMRFERVFRLMGVIA